MAQPHFVAISNVFSATAITDDIYRTSQSVFTSANSLEYLCAIQCCSLSRLEDCSVLLFISRWPCRCTFEYSSGTSRSFLCTAVWILAWISITLGLEVQLTSSFDWWSMCMRSDSYLRFSVRLHKSICPVQAVLLRLNTYENHTCFPCSSIVLIASENLCSIHAFSIGK